MFTVTVMVTKKLFIEPLVAVGLTENSLRLSESGFRSGSRGCVMRWLSPGAWLLLLLTGCASWPQLVSWSRARGPLTATLKELRDLYVIKQQEDYSCGAAALATLMIYYFGDHTSEKEILDRLEARLTEEEKQNRALRGFSLLDLKQVAEEKGYRAAGFQLTMSQLAQVTAPVIIYIEPFGYKHFAVYRGMKQDRIYIADPSRGNLRMSIGRFLDEWSGIVFVLGKTGEEQITSYPLAVPDTLYVQRNSPDSTARGFGDADQDSASTLRAMAGPAYGVLALLASRSNHTSAGLFH